MSAHSTPDPLRLFELDVDVRVRYAECDPQNVVHHSVYPVWFEIARTELLRSHGVNYRQLEAQGTRFVVARMAVRYRKPARYDDMLRVHVRALPGQGVKIDHEYTVLRDDELLATGTTTLVCVDAEGRVKAVPEGLQCEPS